MWLDERVVTLFKRNLQPTLTYWSVFFSFGLCIAFLGPTLLDLRCQTQSSLQQITWVFFSQQFCLLLGSCLGGVFKRTLKQSLVVLFVSTLVISLVFSIIPFCHDVVVLAVVMAVAGLAMGCIDTISNMRLVKIYQKDSAIFLQALHFFVGFGALLSPLIADSFLSETNCIQSNSTVTSNLGHIRNTLVSHHPRNLSHYELPLSGLVITRVSYAFWIMALINLPVPIAVFLLLYKEGMVPCCARKSSSLLKADELAMEIHGAHKEDGHHSSQKSGFSESVEESGHEDFFSCFQSKNFRGAPFSYFAVHVTGALVLFMSDGIVGEYSGFVYTYAAEKPLSMEHKKAGFLPSLFWAFITLGRLIAIPVSYKAKPATMIFVSLTGVLVTFLLLLLFTSYSTIFLFVGTALLGLFLSSIFPSMLAYTEDILNYKGCATTVLVTGAGIGEMVLQMMVGSIIQEQGSYSFLVCGTIFGCLAFSFYVVLLVFHRLHLRPSAELSSQPAVMDESSISYQR
ncbi:major facilitator superfamily domain-containing protein 4A [Microcaecilia unicolor]|uniref:Major facilitator superfamily domain-containing protein 4A n=1 Tax=Microcaecilia unicolor TaxID=1415580 RepID=A0A6P7ZIC6_9AMPH|nr:major facilitator superfamily domain-containing protein 4A [Microcaecilia unicolor]